MPGGKVLTDFTGSDAVYSLAIQSDGKIIAAGVSCKANCDFAMVRYNSNGTVDPTFGVSGKVTLDFGSEEFAYSVATQGDGKILIAGTTGTPQTSDIALARYNMNGTLDNSFGTGGKLTTSVGVGADGGRSIAIQGDGKILVAGYNESGTRFRFALVRYNANGGLDNTFGSGGIATMIIGTDNFGSSVAIQSDGKIVVGGDAVINNLYSDFALARFNIDGSFDNTFGTNGNVTTDFASTGADDGIVSVAIQSNGKILAAGVTNYGGSQHFALARYKSSAALDSTFGTDGKLITYFGLTSAQTHAMALQSDGKIIVTGTSFGNTYDFVTVRYNNVISGIEETGENKRSWAIFPNPSQGVFSLISETISTEVRRVEIYNQLGERIYSETIQSQVSPDIDISCHPRGIYFVKIYDDDKIYSLKIITE